MQACIENTALPLLEAVPAWTIRVSRPATADRDELHQELHGVPKAALRQVFGKLLGTRLWQLHRATMRSATNAVVSRSIAGKSAPTATPHVTPPISDREISTGMLLYLCTEASARLRERKRLAKSISLTVQYPDGESETVREPLPLAANEAAALETVARTALRGLRSDKFVSLKLDLIATPARA